MAQDSLHSSCKIQSTRFRPVMVEQKPIIVKRKASSSNEVITRVSPQPQENKIKRVHFIPPQSPSLEEVMETGAQQLRTRMLNTTEVPTNHLYTVISVFAFLLGGVAIGGCILIYFELVEINVRILSQNSELFGLQHSYDKQIENNSQKLSKPAFDQGWMQYFQSRISTIEKDIDHLRAWANTSACVGGHDFVVGKFCFRLLRFEVDFNQAEDFCKRRNGLLAFADNDTIWDKTVTFLRDHGFNKKEVWTGMQKDSRGNWKYSDGRQATFAKWAKENIFDDYDNCANIRIGVRSDSDVHDCRCTGDDPGPRAFLCRFEIL